MRAGKSAGARGTREAVRTLELVSAIWDMVDAVGRHRVRTGIDENVRAWFWCATIWTMRAPVSRAVAMVQWDPTGAPLH